MTLEKHTILHSVDTGFGTNLSKPVLSYTTHNNGRSVEAHANARGQIIYVTDGVIKVITPQYVWVVPPMQAIWIPGNEIHEVWVNEGAEVRKIFLEPAVTAALPPHSVGFELSEFFAALLVRVIPFSDRTELTDAEWRLVQVLIDEVKVQSSGGLQLPVGKDEKVQIVTDSLIRRMPVEMTLEQAAALAGVKARDFSRLFVGETGMGYADWCIKLKSLEAVKRMASGSTVEQVSVELGYSNTGAFTYEFQKALGKAPRVYLRKSNSL